MKIKDLQEPSLDEKMCPVTIDDAQNIYTYNPTDDYHAEVSKSSAFVSGVESFKQQTKEILPALTETVGALEYGAGKAINKYFPDGLPLFNGQLKVKVGDTLKESGKVLIQAADRNYEMLSKQYAKENPRLEQAQESILFDFGNQGANWTTMLLSGPYAGLTMGGLILGGESKERMQKYKAEHGSIEGYEEQADKDAVFNLANAYVQGLEEKYLGAFAQVKAVKKGMGIVKAVTKNAIQESAITEPIQEGTDFIFDRISGFDTKTELGERLRANLRGFVVAGIFGGAGGFASALYHRSVGIENYKEALKDTVPEQDLEKVATKAYEQDAKTMRDIVTIELEESSSLNAKRGGTYENMYKATLQAMQNAKKQGGYSEVSEVDLAVLAKEEANKFADWTLAEANRRKTTIDSVIDASTIYYDKGKLHIGMTTEIESKPKKAKKLDVKTLVQEKSGLKPQKSVVKKPVEESKAQKDANFYNKIIFFANNDPKITYDKKDMIITDKDGRSMTIKGKDKDLQKLAKEKIKSIKNEFYDDEYYGEIAEDEEYTPTSDDELLEEVSTAFEDELEDVYGSLGSMAEQLHGEKISFRDFKNRRGSKTNAFRKLGEFLLEENNLPLENPEEYAYNYFVDKVYDMFYEAKARQNNYVLLQESLDLAEQNARLDDIYPEYEGETINIDGTEKTVYNSNGDRIAKSEQALRNFYKWFGDSKVIDEQGRPKVMYHGTRQQNISEFKSRYGDKLIFFAYKKEFSERWAENAYQSEEQQEKARQISDEKHDKSREISERYNKDFGGNWTDDKDLFNSAQEELKAWQKEREKELGLAPIVMDVYLKAEKTFIPSENWEQVLPELLESNGFTKEDAEVSSPKEIKRAEKEYERKVAELNKKEEEQKVEPNSKEWEENSKEFDRLYQELQAVRDKGKSFQSHLSRIKEGAWVYFERESVMKRIRELGYDSIKLKEYSDGEDTTLAVFEGNNQIKSTDNRGTYSLEDDNIYYQSAYAGSRVDYDEPSLEALGSGEGNQAHGWGLYYALNKDVAEDYRKTFIGDNEIIEYKGKKYSKDEDKNEFLALESMRDSETKEEAIEYLNDSIERTKKRISEIEDSDAKDRLQVMLDNTQEQLEFAKKVDFEDISKGQVHEVDIPEMPALLDEQEMLIDQSNFIQEKVKEISDELNLGIEDSGIRGVAIYEKISDKLGSDKKASEYLRSKGIKGITYDGRRDGRCFVIFDSKDVKVVQKFYQGQKKHHGSIEFKGGEALIELTDSANASTLPHELAHYWLENTFLYTKSGLASPEYAQFYKSIADFLGIQPDQEKLERWQQEKWARSYEQYLLTQKAPSPELENAFKNYNKWIKRAYRYLKSKPKYRNSEGKMVEPKLTPEIIETFGRLTNEFVARPDIEEMAETVTPELEKAVEEYETKVNEEIKQAEKETISDYTRVREQAEEGDSGRSSVAMRVLGEELGYDVKNIKDQMESARKFVRNNLKEARRVAMGGEAPKGLLSTAVNIAYVEAMEKSGNYKEAEKATRIRSLEQTRRGQEIAMERATTDNVLSAEYWSNMLLARKAQEVAKKNFNGDVKALQDFINKNAEDIAKAIEGKDKEERKKIIKEKLEENNLLYQADYDDLVDAESYDEILNETQIMIEDSLGLKAEEEQVDFIHNNVRILKDIVDESVSENGNLSVEAFRQIRKMHDTIESYSPSSNIAVWSSIIGRGLMLASVKSPILNIISNTENYLTETLSRKAQNGISGKTNDNIVDDKLIKDYLNWSKQVYKASGYMPSVTTDILGETPILGEKRLSSQGKGTVRALGRLAEDTVFKYLMGYPDSVFKDYNFVDVVANKATQKAFDEGLKGEQAVKRANELFEDAILLKPETDEGAEIRKQGMIAAHEATFTQDSEISKIALKIRDVLNSGEFKAGDFLVPFVKTPANVVALGLEYSLGAIYTGYHVQDIMKDPTSEVSQRAIKAAVRNGVGMLLAMMLAALVDDDDYLPEYDNASPKQRDLAKLKNAPFNSVKIGSKWINLDYFGPLAIPMAGVLTARSKQNLSGFLQGIGGQAMKTPGVKDITNLIGSTSRAIQYGVSFKDVVTDTVNWGVEQVASRSIPAFVNDFGKLIDSYERETGGEMSRRVMSKIPFVRETLPIRTDVLGRKVETEPTNLFFGARVKTAVDNKVVEELDRLGRENKAPTLSDPTRYGSFRKLETKVKDKVRAEFGKEYGKEVKELMNSYSYKNGDDSRKQKLLNKVRSKITKDLKRKYLKNNK